MKFIVIAILSTFSCVVWGQNLFSPKVRRTTTPNNGKFVDYPSITSESKTIINKSDKKVSYKICLKEYVDHKHKPDDFELIEFVSLTEGGSLQWILTPDTSNCQHIKIFSHYRSGSMSLREKITVDPNKYFDYKFFHYSKDIICNEEVPLLLIYEANIKNRFEQKGVCRFLHNGMLNSQNIEEITSQLNRYMIVYYIAN